MTDEFFRVNEEFYTPAEEFSAGEKELFDGAKSEYFAIGDTDGKSAPETGKKGGPVSFKRVMIYAACSLVMTVAVTTALSGSFIWGNPSSSGEEYEYDYEDEPGSRYEYELDEKLNEIEEHYMQHD